ncbi:MAG: hypothetical protein HY815_32700, partial [Candidatus Riflebacteria bacterium]|nr:hypothetical protein [Candidatus Riflebacteria bacterium]
MRPLHLLLATILLVPAPCWPLPEAALARLELALQDAVRSNRPAEVVRVLVLAGELKARLGDRRALVLVRKAVERAQVLDDPRLVHWAALVAAQVARRLGDGTDPFLYLKVAQEAVERGRGLVGGQLQGRTEDHRTGRGTRFML